MLKLETVYKSEYFKVEVDQNSALARSEWLRSVNDTELMDGAILLRQILIEHQVEKILANGKNLCTLAPQSKEWLATSYYQTLSQTPAKKLARILPSNLFHHIALEAVMARAEATTSLSYSFRNFSQEREAVTWLLA